MSETTQDESCNCTKTKVVHRGGGAEAVYGLGFLNIINRPTRDITLLRKGEERTGRARIARTIKAEKPKVVCFVGKVAYEKFIGHKKFDFGWQPDVGSSKAFVMHFPLRGEAIVRVRELMLVAQVAKE